MMNNITKWLHNYSSKDTPGTKDTLSEILFTDLSNLLVCAHEELSERVEKDSLPLHDTGLMDWSR